MEYKVIRLFDSSDDDTIPIAFVAQVQDDAFDSLSLSEFGSSIPERHA